VQLQYLQPLLKGIGYYEASGYYAIPHEQAGGAGALRAHAHMHNRTCTCTHAHAHACTEQAYFNARHTPTDCAPPQVAAARRAAAARLSDFEALRCAPFRGGALCAALEALAERDEAAATAVPPPPDPRHTLIWRFAHAVAAAQEASPSEGSPTGEGAPTAPAARVAAFRAAAARDDAAAPPLPHRLNVHSRTPLPVSPSLGAFAERHAAALDAQLLGAPHLGALAGALHARNRAGGEAGLRAGALLLPLMFDLFAAWAPRRDRPHLRKDFQAVAADDSGGGGGGGGGVSTCSVVELDSERGGGAQIGVRPTPEPIIQQAFVLDSLQLQPSPSEWGV